MSVAETIGGTAGSIAGGALGGLIGGIFGPVGVVAGRYIGSQAGRLAGAAAAVAIADMIENADKTGEKDLSDEAADEPCKDCADDPCKHLRKGKGTGPYRGGAHGETRLPKRDNLDSHHMPPKSAYRGPIDEDDLPAIQMTPKDHEKTMSHAFNADRRGARAWRDEQRRLLDEGRYKEAMRRDIDDARRIAREAGDPTRYDEAIAEMEAYAACREQHGLTESSGGGGNGTPSGGTEPGGGPGAPPTS